MAETWLWTVYLMPPLAWGLFKVIVYSAPRLSPLGGCPWLAPKNGYQSKRWHMSSVHSPRISSWQHPIVVTSRAQKAFYCGNLKSIKGRALWVFLVTLLPNDIAVCFSHADSFEILTKIFISFFGWKWYRYSLRSHYFRIRQIWNHDISSTSETVFGLKSEYLLIFFLWNMIWILSTIITSSW